jgi:hypothetical protein
MLIGIRLSLYAFAGANLGLPPFPGPPLSFHYIAGSIGDAPYQPLSIRRNENSGQRKYLSGLQAEACKPISGEPRFVGILLEMAIR